MINTAAPAAPEPIAIIGIGCRFPGGAHDPRAFWTMLCEGVDAITEVPADRWSTRLYYHPDSAHPGTAVTRWGGFLQQRIDELDTLFFGISPREAEQFDPMQRWLLEVAWEALEDAGQNVTRLAGTNTGVFIGAFTDDIRLFDFSESNRDRIGTHTVMGAMKGADRLAYTLDLHGPSVSLDTACSSSLVAVHLACQSLWTGECTLALAGGANAMFEPEYTIAESKAGMLSPDGRCKTFDARANGYVRGEGAGIVVLKPLTRALADGDPIYALIRGSAINQDGHTPSISVPNGAAQEALMREACRRAGVSPAQIQYVEAHGTGTPMGDPIEANALAAVLATDRPAGETCLIGSVKTNIGHLEGAAGVAGLIKAALCLKHRQVPPHLHLQEPNPKIPFADLCIRVPRSLEPWPETHGPALAAVNSFGFGGANAHVILQEAPRTEDCLGVAGGTASPARAELLPLSARTAPALRAVAGRFDDYLGDAASHDVALIDIAATASLRRSHHDHRVAVVAASHEEARTHLQSFLAEGASPGLSSGRTSANRQPRIAFVFSGMGPQWWAMGRDLLRTEPIFRATVERCDELLRPYASWSLLEEFTVGEERSRMGETQIAQPANFALQVGLLALWRSWGIEPDAIVGHSAGEVAAAYAAGALSLEEATRVIFHRSRLQHRTTGQGRLVAVGLPLAEARSALVGYGDRISIAAVNSPTAVTLVGDPEALEPLVQSLQQREVFCRFLAVDVPYHSHYMDVLHDELLESLQGLTPRRAVLPLFSTVTGAAASGLELDASYWWRNVRDPVLFAAAVDGLIGAGCDTFLELSPHPVLANSITECLTRHEQQGAVLPSLRRRVDERRTMLESLGTLYTQGTPIAWAALYPDGGRYTPLPAYPWQREHYWDETEASRQDRFGDGEHPLMGRRLQSAYPAWETTIDEHALPFLTEHRIADALVFPGAGYLEMALAAAAKVGGASLPVTLRDVAFRKALFVGHGDAVPIQLTLDPRTQAFAIHSRSSDGASWVEHAGGTLCPTGQRRVPAIVLPAILARCPEVVTADECYRRFTAIGLQYGPAFRGIDQLWRGRDEVCARVRVPDAVEADRERYHMHPALLDTCLHTMLTTILPPDASASMGAYLPVTIDELTMYRPPRGAMWVHACRRVEQGEDSGRVVGDLQVCDDAGEIILAVHGLCAISLQARRDAAPGIEDLLYELQWHPEEPSQEADAEAPGQQPAGPGVWLLFADATGFGRSLAALLQERGETCVMVRPAEAYTRADREQPYAVNPERPEDFDRLFADVRGALPGPVRGVVHMWGLDSSAADEPSVTSLRGAQTTTCAAVLHIVQALQRAELSEVPRLWCMTRGAQAAGMEKSPVAVEQAPLWGVARTIGHQEHPALWGGIVDLDPAAPAGEASLIIDDLYDGRRVDQLIVRGRQRYVPRMVARRDHGAGRLAPAFRADGTYLITGGAGGLGLKVARWMVDHGARRLILLGRSALPPRDTWSEVAADSPLGHRVMALRDLEARGASIYPAAVDVADEAALTAFLTRYRREGWPPIRGVFHAAGVIETKLMLQMDAGIFDTVLPAKVCGAWLLHRLLKDDPLDHFVLFSSISALGIFAAGLSAYAAGNAFLDALAQHRRTLGLPALSVNWGPWAEVGMASVGDRTDYGRRRGVLQLHPDAGLRALGHLLQGNSIQATVFAADWPMVELYGYQPGYVPAMLSPLLRELQDSAPADESPLAHGGVKQELAGLTGVAERQGLIESYLRTQLARVLRLSAADLAQLAVDEPLQRLGLDSIMALELTNAVERDLGATLSPIAVLQGTSLAQLTTTALDRVPAASNGGMSVDGELAADAFMAAVDQLSLGTVDSVSH